MKYAKFSDDFLSYFRLDDNGKTLVLTDKRGNTRAVKLYARPIGTWKRLNEIRCKCSKCDFAFDDFGILFNYCPNCGADMRGKEE